MKKKDVELNYFFKKTYTFTLKYNSYFVEIFVIRSSHARVVKASDKKSDGFITRRFESCWLRYALARGAVFQMGQYIIFFLRFVSSIKLLRFSYLIFEKKRCCVESKFSN